MTAFLASRGLTGTSAALFRHDLLDCCLLLILSTFWTQPLRALTPLNSASVKLHMPVSWGDTLAILFSELAASIATGRQLSFLENCAF